LEQGGYYVGWDTEKLKRRLVDLVKFKESPTWKVVGGERRIAENKFRLKEEDLIGLAALLEKVVGLREDAKKDKEEKTQAKRKREDEERERGLAIRFSAMQGMIRTEQLSLNSTQNASLVADPQRKRRKKSQPPAHIFSSPGGGIVQNSTNSQSTEVELPPAKEFTTTPLLWMPQVSPVHQVHRQVTASASSESHVRPTLPAAKLSSMFLELLKSQEAKQQQEKDELKEEIVQMKNELTNINCTLEKLCMVMEDIRTRTEIFRQREH